MLFRSVGPRFQLTVSRDGSTGLDLFHPASPAGRLIQFVGGVGHERLSGFHFDLQDETEGGFGRSSAEFLLLYRWIFEGQDELLNWKKAYSLYRELTAGPQAFRSPSGADIVAQWRGGLTWFDPEAVAATEVYALFDWNRFLVFSATARDPDRKTATHSHLKNAKEIPASVLSALVDASREGILGVQEGSEERVARAMTRTAKTLQSLDLEDPRTTQDRDALSRLSGVLAVKGCGANQSDALLVLMNTADPEVRAAVIQAARARGLELVSDGIPSEMGIHA
ncbi:MAG: hypothetical protein JNL01_11915 [Bdellovibrionales bacterium]|nr:hypothetical protein [Bdellovibrionales bacterium]